MASRLWIHCWNDRTRRSRVRSTLKNSVFSSEKSPWMIFPTGSSRVKPEACDPREKQRSVTQSAPELLIRALRVALRCRVQSRGEQTALRP